MLLVTRLSLQTVSILFACCPVLTAERLLIQLSEQFAGIPCCLNGTLEWLNGTNKRSTQKIRRGAGARGKVNDCGFSNETMSAVRLPARQFGRA